MPKSLTQSLHRKKRVSSAASSAGTCFRRLSSGSCDETIREEENSDDDVSMDAPTFDAPVASTSAAAGATSAASVTRDDIARDLVNNIVALANRTASSDDDVSNQNKNTSTSAVTTPSTNHTHSSTSTSTTSPSQAMTSTNSQSAYRKMGPGYSVLASDAVSAPAVAGSAGVEEPRRTSSRRTSRQNSFSSLDVVAEEEPVAEDLMV